MNRRSQVLPRAVRRHLPPLLLQAPPPGGDQQELRHDQRHHRARALRHRPAGARLHQHVQDKELGL